MTPTRWSGATLLILCSALLVTPQDDVSFCRSEEVFLRSMETEVVIKSPFHPADYPPRQDCTFDIEALPGYRIRIAYTTFELERANDFGNCVYDYVSIYDGASDDAVTFGTFCGQTAPPVILSTNRRLRVIFHSDASIQETGFEATVKMVDSSYEEAIPTPDPSICYEIFDETAGVILSPGYPSNYQNNQECTYLITLPTDDTILLRFTSFDLESSYDCVYDYVEVRDGNTFSAALIGRYCGGTLNDPPTVIESSGSDMFVFFHSDYSERYKGFYAEYVDSDTGFPETDASLETNGDVEICDLSHAVLDSKGGAIVSHEGQGSTPYPVSKTCTIEIIGNRPSEMVYINVVMNDLKPAETCGESGDYLELSTTPPTQLCGTDRGHFSTTTPSASITLYSDENGNEDFKGFRLVYAIYYEDFHGCEEGYFQCENNRCIIDTLICDGFDHCDDSSDERDICEDTFDTKWIFAILTILAAGLLFICCLGVSIRMAMRKTPYRSPRSASGTRAYGETIPTQQMTNQAFEVNPPPCTSPPPTYSQIWTNSTTVAPPSFKNLYDQDSAMNMAPVPPVLLPTGEIRQPKRGMLPPLNTVT